MDHSALWNLYGLCAFAVKKEEPQRHEGHKGGTKKSNDHFHAVCRITGMHHETALLFFAMAAFYVLAMGKSTSKYERKAVLVFLYPQPI